MRPATALYGVRSASDAREAADVAREALVEVLPDTYTLPDEHPSDGSRPFDVSVGAAEAYEVPAAEDGPLAYYVRIDLEFGGHQDVDTLAYARDHVAEHHPDAAVELFDSERAATAKLSTLLAP